MWEAEPLSRFFTPEKVKESMIQWDVLVDAAVKSFSGQLIYAGQDTLAKLRRVKVRLSEADVDFLAHCGVSPR